MKPNTWAWLIHRYQTDEFSPYSEVKQNTRKGYDWTLEEWDKIIGHLDISAVRFEQIKTIERTMRNKGRSNSYVSRLFNMLRMLTTYGTAIECDAAVTVNAILRAIKFKTAAPRDVAPTSDQVQAVIARADDMGLHDFAAGLLLQWTFALRPVDVRGQWFDADERDGGIIRKVWVKRGGRSYEKVTRWQDGLTWDMVSADLRTIAKTVSKTAESTRTKLHLDLSPAPDLRQRLASLSGRDRTGPVILSDDGLPYTTAAWGLTFRRIRDDLGLPSDIQVMDLRAGAITEARDLGAPVESLRDFAGHKTTNTTQRYMRSQNQAAARVVQLRSQG